MTAPLRVHYNATAAAAAHTLDPRQRHALDLAVGLLATLPYPAESIALTPDGIERHVRASQTVALTYRVTAEYLRITGIAGEPRTLELAPARRHY